MVPRLLHFYWEGPHCPETLIDTWRQLHPTWTVKVWSADDLKQFDTENVHTIFNRSAKPNLRSDVARLEILYRHGGVYVDCDVLCVRRIDDLIASGVTVIQEKVGLISNSFIAAPADSPIIDALRSAIFLDPTVPVWKCTGPKVLTETLVSLGTVTPELTSKVVTVLPGYCLNLGIDLKHSLVWGTEPPVGRNRDLDYLGDFTPSLIIGYQCFMGGKGYNYARLKNVKIQDISDRFNAYVASLTERVDGSVKPVQ